MSNVFINLSNHPSSKWTEAQYEAAKHYFDEETEIIDLAFPAVDPLIDDLAPLAGEIMEKVTKAAENYDKVALMLQGEQSLIEYISYNAGYYVSNLNQSDPVPVTCGNSVLDRAFHACWKKRIEVLTAPTERKCVENPDGTRTYAFEFVKFRKVFTF